MWTGCGYLGRGLRLAAALACGLITAGILSQHLMGASKPQHAAACDAPEFFGVCDPYVPGTIIQLKNRKPILVVTTWPGGPADKAGICAGDKIVAVNDVSAYTHTSNEMLRQIASASPTPITIGVQRGKQDMNLRVPRVRESTLLRLSKQKSFNFNGLYYGRSLISVPLNEKREEVTALENFEKELVADYGLKIVPNLGPIPKATPEDHVKQLQELLSRGGALRPRIAGVASIGGARFGTGASVVVLKNPEEVVVWHVLPGSPAFRAGLLSGDHLLQVDGHELSGPNVSQIKDALSKPDAQRTISLRVKRGASRLTLKLETEDAGKLMASNPVAEIPALAAKPVPNSYFLGAQAVYDGVAQKAMVSHLDYPSPAFAAGLHPGDLILALNNIPVSKLTRAQVEALLSPQAPSPVIFKIDRLGRKLSFTVVPATHAEALAKIGRKLTKFGPASQGCPG